MSATSSSLAPIAVGSSAELASPGSVSLTHRIQWARPKCLEPRCHSSQRVCRFAPLTLRTARVVSSTSASAQTRKLALSVLKEQLAREAKADIPVSTEPAAEKPPVQLTDEQKRFVYSTMPLEPGRIQIANALAGTGKTEAENQFMAARSNMRMLYCVFNREMKNEAQERFKHLSHVSVYTLHALGVEYSVVRCGRIACFETKVFREHVRTFLMTHHTQLATSLDSHLWWYLYATLDEFAKSAEVEAERVHLSRAQQAFDRACRMQGFSVSSEQRLRAPSALADVSDQHADLPESSIDQLMQLTHALTRAIQSDAFPYVDFNWSLKYMHWKCTDYGSRYPLCVIDEAQDVFPVAKAFVRNQQWAIIAVGDSRQQIYRFLSGDNVLQQWQSVATETHFFSQTFRFGPTVADFITRYFSHFQPLPKPMVSLLATDTQVCPTQSTYPYKMNYIGRTKLSLVGKAIELAQRGQAFSVCSTLQETLNELMRWITKPLQAVQARLERARAEWDEKLVCILSYLERHKRNSAGNWSFLSDFHRVRLLLVRPNSTEATAHLMTGHSVKGLDFNHVEVLSDFDEAFVALSTSQQQQSSLSAEDEDELFLLYVTLTRAREIMYLPPALYKFYQTNVLPTPSLCTSRIN